MPAKKESAQQEIRVALDSSRLKNSYANVFETRFSESEIFLTCGISHMEQQGEENILAVQLENRIVMTPASAFRLNQALAELLAQWNNVHGSAS